MPQRLWHPLYLSHTVTDIHGRARLEAVTVSQVDERLRPIPGTEERVECDTLILSVGLIPAGDIANGSGLAVDGRTKGAFVDEHYQTSIPGVFAAGNVLHVSTIWWTSSPWRRRPWPRRRRST